MCFHVFPVKVVSLTWKNDLISEDKTLRLTGNEIEHFEFKLAQWCKLPVQYFVFVFSRTLYARDIGVQRGIITSGKVLYRLS